MKLIMKIIFISITFLAFFYTYVKTDLPVHCLKSQVFFFKMRLWVNGIFLQLHQSKSLLQSFTNYHVVIRFLPESPVHISST